MSVVSQTVEKISTVTVTEKDKVIQSDIIIDKNIPQDPEEEAASGAGKIKF